MFEGEGDDEKNWKLRSRDTGALLVEEGDSLIGPHELLASHELGVDWRHEDGLHDEGGLAGVRQPQAHVVPGPLHDEGQGLGFEVRRHGTLRRLPSLAQGVKQPSAAGLVERAAHEDVDGRVRLA